MKWQWQNWSCHRFGFSLNSLSHIFISMIQKIIWTSSWFFTFWHFKDGATENFKHFSAVFSRSKPLLLTLSVLPSSGTILYYCKGAMFCWNVSNFWLIVTSPEHHCAFHFLILFKVTAINFILPLNLKFKCEFEFTKYLRGTKCLFAIYQTSQIWILINQRFSN